MRKKWFWLSLVAALAFVPVWDLRSCLAGRVKTEPTMERSYTTELIVGMRKMGHYTNASIVSTPPTTLMAEAQMTFWDRDIAALYFLFSKSYLLANTTTWGGGLKLPFMKYRGSSGDLFRQFSVLVLADFIYFSTEPAVSPKAYDSTGFFLRPGIGVNLRVMDSGAFFEAALLATRISTAFVIAPFAGVGFRF